MTRAKRSCMVLRAGMVMPVLALALILPAAAQEKKKPDRVCPTGRVQLVKFKTVKGSTLPAAIEKPLSRTAGDAERGLEIAVDTSRGDCLACHHIAKVLLKAEQDDAASVEKYGRHGEVGAPLNGVAGRFSEAELRLIVAEPQKAFPDADIAMPAYHAIKDQKDVHPHCKGRPMLSAQEVEDVVAFLQTLK